VTVGNFISYLPCSHVLVTCKHTYHDFDVYISPVYTLKQVSHVYKGQFGKLRDEDYRPTYTG